MAKNPLELSDEEIAGMSDEDFLTDDFKLSDSPQASEEETPDSDLFPSGSSTFEEDMEAAQKGDDTAPAEERLDPSPREGVDGEEDGGGDSPKTDDKTDNGKAKKGPKNEDAPNPLAAPDDQVDADGDGKGGKQPAADGGDDKKGSKEPEAKSDDKPEGEKSEDGKPEEPAKNFDYEAGYKKIMEGFKANGENFEVKSPEDAIALMQRGVGFTRKMQQLKPHLKTVRMLENAGVLNDEKLGFLIDLNNGEPEAIKKFLKDKNIDPMDLDTSEEPNYKPGNHTVSDKEMAFTTALDDLQVVPGGKETITEIEQKWDRASQERLFAEPSLLGLFNEQRNNGIYSQITTEVDRLKTLGVIPDGTSFLDAYKAVGDNLHVSGRLMVNGVSTLQAAQGQGQGGQPAPQSQQQPSQQGNGTPAEPPAPLEARPLKPKPAASNDALAKAAAPARSAPPKKGFGSDFNPLSMSDEDFEKMTNFNI